MPGRHPDSGRGRPHCDPSLGAQSSNPDPGLGPPLTPELLSEPSVLTPTPSPRCLIPQEAGASVSSSCHWSRPRGGEGCGGCGRAAGNCSGGWGPRGSRGGTVGPGASGSGQASGNPELQNTAISPCSHSPGKHSTPPSGPSQPASRAVRLPATLPAPLTCTRSPGAGQRVPGGSRTPPRPPCRPPPPARARAGPRGRHTARR